MLQPSRGLGHADGNASHGCETAAACDGLFCTKNTAPPDGLWQGFHEADSCPPRATDDHSRLSWCCLQALPGDCVMKLDGGGVELIVAFSAM